MTRAASRPLYRAATRAAWVGLGGNLLLGGGKLWAGLDGGSFGLISDAFNSLGDAVTSTVVLLALGYSQKPADEEHPWGHSRAEAVAGSSAALLIILSALAIGYQAFGELRTHDHAPPESWTLWVALIGLVVKEGLYQYHVRVGHRTGSQALIAIAWDHRADAFSSLTVVLGLAAVRWGGPAWELADAIAALVVCLIILIAGIRLYRTSFAELLDQQADDAFLDQVRSTASAIEGVRRVEKLRVRKSGIEHLVNIHVQVDPDATVAHGHEIGHLVKDALMAEHAVIRDVHVHLEPYGPEASPDKRT